MATSQGTHTRRAGVPPIAPSQAQATDTSRSTRAKASAAQDGVKAKIRWLPPGLTEDEFTTILGDTWKLGKGKISWFRYSRGHIPKSASKDPTPSWALLQVKEDDIDALAQAVREAVWEDAKGTYHSPTLIGPPYVERAIYKKIPASRSRKDPKEGTIDQDDEWQKFLVSLTESSDVKKEESEAAADDATTIEANAKPAVTSLVAHILESKANKAKESANAKSRKHARQESQGKGKGAAAALATTTSTDEPKKRSKDKSDKPKETVKILKKQAATEAAAEAANAVAKEIKAGGAASESAGNRRKMGISDILKRDLGLAGPSSSRKGRQEAAAAAKSTEPVAQGQTKAKERETKGQENGAPATASSSAQTNDRSAATATSKATAEKSSRGGRRRGGKDAKTAETKSAAPAEPAAATPVKPTMILQKKKEEPPAPPVKEPVNTKATTKGVSKSTNKSSQKPAPAVAASTPSSASVPAPASAPPPSTPAAAPNGPKASTTKGSQSGGSQKKSSATNPASASTRAFLKHANPSQGVTEPLLREAMQAFGGVSSVEIDRRKGFAYVDFADHSGLAKAMAASPVTIANAAVQVLERKDQTSKKLPTATAAAPSNNSSPQSPVTKDAAKNTTKEKETPSTPAAAPSSTPLSTAPSEKGGIDQQQPKRSRRRGRGKGGNGGASGNAEGKTGDQNKPSGNSGSAARSNVTGDAPKTG
ncbi:Smg-4/UPF3 family-domain-containing protein [Coniella lustricola]|uniref:Smg-4/UPF3 family-domain-containing protein n=1 Tax=Coniella lustricola TaxID=2025994 RepID=A0A2T2ZU78_9PEZI|nr:Smg-4/UPF3 family-domain-containing protein [Coniella lustricola]